jgi:divalent metal cation (Fe/Co/Zn/Cd) transporter
MSKNSDKHSRDCTPKATWENVTRKEMRRARAELVQSSTRHHRSDYVFALCLIGAIMVVVMCAWCWWQFS